MNNLISAIQFITIIPTGTRVRYNPLGMIKYFPVVGLMVGAALVVFDIIARMLWPPETASVLDVVFLIVLTGAFHLDGVGDAADGLLGHRDREKILLIMKDSTIGVMAFAAMACCLAVKWSGITSLSYFSQNERLLLLLIIPAYSRGSMIFGIRFLKYGRDSGTGKALFEKKIPLSSFALIAVPVFISCFLGLTGLMLNLYYLIIIGGILFYYNRRMNCITGDMLGAMTEITESMLFILISAGGFK